MSMKGNNLGRRTLESEPESSMPLGTMGVDCNISVVAFGTYEGCTRLTPYVHVLHARALRDLDAWDGEDVDVVLCPTSAYERDLGMHTRGAVRRQLAVDLPRSHVTSSSSSRCLTPDEVCAATQHVRLCTQAVMAPVVEWCMRSGYVAMECGGPLQVSVAPRTGALVATKELRVAPWECGGEVCIVDKCEGQRIMAIIIADADGVLVQLRKV